jgi:hypothetical protein
MCKAVGKSPSRNAAVLAAIAEGDICPMRGLTPNENKMSDGGRGRALPVS